MRKITLKSGLELPAVSVGCMRLTGLDTKQAEKFINTALDEGVNFFDHADIYGGGRCEELFSEAINMSPSIREKLILQTKCGITSGRYDFSAEHILKSVDGSLKRLKTDYIDILLLHRPDALAEPEEVADTFQKLYDSGKVRHFGVSNHTPYQMALLQKYMTMPLEVNQIQLSITHSSTIAQGMNMNNYNDNALSRDNGLLDYCRLNDIVVQAWSPLQSNRGCFIDNPNFEKLNTVLAEIAARYGRTKEAIAIAWLSRHPANIQPVTGTMNNERIVECIKGSEIRLTRDEWYDLYKAAGNGIL